MAFYCLNYFSLDPWWCLHFSLLVMSMTLLKPPVWLFCQMSLTLDLSAVKMEAVRLGQDCRSHNATPSQRLLTDWHPLGSPGVC